MKFSQIIAGAVLTVAATTAFAAPITVEVVSADWTDVVGGSNVDYISTDGLVGNEEVRWGGNSGAKSGYRFESSAPPAFDVETDIDFDLGEFTHFNFPIPAGTSPSSLILNISADLQVDGVSLSEGPFNFNFLHNETPNQCNSGPDCANDLISLESLTTSDSFSVNGVEYTLSIEGFSVNGVMTDVFSTVERQTNSASLIGRFTAVTPVSAPSTLALFALGLVGLGFARRRA